MSNEKPEYTLVPQDGELQPVGKMPTLTAEQVSVLVVIQSVSKVEVLANVEETAAGIIKMKTSYLPIVEKAKHDLSAVKTKADLDRVKRPRLDIAKERGDFVDGVNAELSVRRELIKNAVKGRDAVEEAFKSIESEIYAIEKPIEDAFKAEAARKKALADAIAKLKSHAINPLLSAADIENAIDDFRLSFGDTDYADSQDAAEAIFESKITEFETILLAAVVREENERKVKEQEMQSQQRANISESFPLADISGYGHNGTSEEIKAATALIKEVDMTAFELVLTEAEIAKQSCLNMLGAFLSIAQAREAKEAADKAELKRVAEIKARIKMIADRPNDFIGQESPVILSGLNTLKAMVNGDFAEFKSEAELTLKDAIERLTIILNGTLKKEAADKAESERLEREKQYQNDWDLAILQYATWCENKKLIKETADKMARDVDLDIATESAIIELINDDAGVDFDFSEWFNGVHFDDAEPIEVLSEVNEDDCVAIPVKHLKSLIRLANYAISHYGAGNTNVFGNNDLSAIAFAKSLI